MKFTKSQRNNLILFSIIALLMFTPLGNFVSVQIHALKTVFIKPSIIKEENQVEIAEYNWKLKSQEGATVNFDSFKGEIILVNLWATWCPPCVAEMPNLQKLYNDYGDRIRFVFVANDKKDAVAKYMSDKQFNFPVYYSLTKEPSELHSKSIPATFLIGVNGEIVIKEIGAYDWNSKKVRTQIDEMLAFSLAE